MIVHQKLIEKFIKMYDGLLIIIKNHKKMITKIVKAFLYVIDISLYLIEKLLIMLMIIEIINNLPFSKEMYEIRSDEIKILASAFLMYGFMILWLLKFIGKKVHIKQAIRLLPWLPLAYIFIKLLIKIEKIDLMFLWLMITFCRIIFDLLHESINRYITNSYIRKEG